MKFLNQLIGLFIIVIMIPGCENSSNMDNFDYGNVESGVYQNDYFDFKIKLPEVWVVQSKEQTELISDAGRNLIAGDDDNMKAIFEASEINVANLLVAFQYEMGTPVDYNSNIMVVAENIKNSPGVKNGSDYLFLSRKIIEQGQLKYDYLSKEFESETINNVEFHKMEAQLNYVGIEIKQIYYSTILKGFSFNVIISYATDEQKEILLKALNSMDFDK